MSTPDLNHPEVVAVIRLPIPVSQLGAIAQAWPDHDLEQVDEFVEVRKPKSKPKLP